MPSSKEQAAALQTAATDDSIDLDERDVRALEQYLTVLDDYGRARDADDLYMVVSQSGEEYLVDSRAGTCECPDFEYRTPAGGCKHVRRVAFATGERAIPGGVDRDDVDEQLGIHVSDGGPRVVATDGGVTGANNWVVASVLQDDVDDAGDDERPDDCECEPWMDGHLPCFECWRRDFDEPNPDVLDEGGDDA